MLRRRDALARSTAGGMGGALGYLAAVDTTGGSSGESDGPRDSRSQFPVSIPDPPPPQLNSIPEYEPPFSIPGLQTSQEGETALQSATVDQVPLDGSPTSDSSHGKPPTFSRIPYSLGYSPLDVRGHPDYPHQDPVTSTRQELPTETHSDPSSQLPITSETSRFSLSSTFGWLSDFVPGALDPRYGTPGPPSFTLKQLRSPSEDQIEKFTRRKMSEERLQRNSLSIHRASLASFHSYTAPTPGRARSEPAEEPLVEPLPPRAYDDWDAVNLSYYRPVLADPAPSEFVDPRLLASDDIYAASDLPPVKGTWSV